MWGYELLLMVSTSGKSSIASTTTGSDPKDRPTWLWHSPKAKQYIDALDNERKGTTFFEEICMASETVHQYRDVPPIRQLMTDALDLHSLESVQQAGTRDERRSAVKVAIVSQINRCCGLSGSAKITKLPSLRGWDTLLASNAIVFRPGSSGVTLQEFIKEFNPSKEPGGKILSSLYKALKAGCIIFHPASGGVTFSS